MPDQTISSDELALRLGVAPEKVESLARAGALDPRSDGRFDPGDVHRLRLLLAFERAGVPLDALLDASQAGAISLDYYDELHASPGALSTRSYAEFGASLGPWRGHLPRLFAAFGLAEPEAGTRLSEDDERLLRDMVETIVATRQPDLVLRAIRMLGEGARRAADGALGVYGEAVTLGADDLRGLPNDELFDRLLRPWARLARLSPAIASWLTDRHMSRAIDDWTVTESERILEEAGVVASRPDVPPAIAFVDLTGFTKLTEERGDDVAAAMALQMGDVTIETIRRTNGRIVKLLGDGILVRFADATAAAESALDLLDALPAAGLPSAHAGLAAGPLIERDGDVFGRTVNLAARVADVAPDGHVYAPQSTATGLDPERFTLGGIPDRALQGIGRVSLVDIGRR